MSVHNSLQCLWVNTIEVHLKLMVSWGNRWRIACFCCCFDFFSRTLAVVSVCNYKSSLFDFTDHMYSVEAYSFSGFVYVFRIFSTVLPFVATVGFENYFVPPFLLPNMFYCTCILFSDSFNFLFVGVIGVRKRVVVLPCFSVHLFLV